jgi:signal peptidase I
VISAATGSAAVFWVARRAAVLAAASIALVGVAPAQNPETGSGMVAAHRLSWTASRVAMAEAESVAAQHEGDFVVVGVGASMEPCYASGTVLVIHPTSYFMLRSGMSVVYRNRSGRQVAHVLVREGRDGWIARGVNNAGADAERVTRENLVGVVRCAFAPESSGPSASLAFRQ